MDLYSMFAVIVGRLWVDGFITVYPVWVDGILISSIWDRTLIRWCMTVTILIHIIKGSGKVLFGRNTLYNPIVYRIHGYYYCLLFLILLTVYTITVYWFILVLLSLYYSSTLGNMILIVLTKLNNNLNEQLTLGLRKLIEETTSVFWVDLGYRLRSRDRVLLQGSRGWLTFHTIIVLLLL